MALIGNILAVAAGASLGGGLRYVVGLNLTASAARFPWGTLVINVTGSLLLGLLVGISLIRGWSDGWRLFLGVGFCGGYTTFSAFAFDFVRLWDEDAYVEAAAYLVATNVISILACASGAILARRLFMT